MKHPPEFDRLALQMHADFDIVPAGKSLEQTAEHLCLALRSPEERRTVALFIGSILAEDPSDETLAQIWAETPSDCFLKPAHARAFFEALARSLGT